MDVRRPGQAAPELPAQDATAEGPHEQTRQDPVERAAIGPLTLAGNERAARNGGQRVLDGSARFSEDLDFMVRDGLSLLGLSKLVQQTLRLPADLPEVQDRR